MAKPMRALSASSSKVRPFRYVRGAFLAVFAALTTLLPLAPAAAQSLTLTNLRPVLAPLCPKAGTVTTIAALYRELAACAPKPALSGVMVMGQSHSVNYVGYWSGAIRRDNPTVNWLPDLNAAGASIAKFEGWLPEVEQRDPAVVIMSIIPEDLIVNLPRYNALFCKVRATGAKVVVNNPWATRTTTPESRKVAIQCADAIADFASHPVLGRQGADDNPALYRDPIHWTEISGSGGHDHAYAIWARAIGQVLPIKPVAEPAPPITPFTVSFDIARGLQRTWGAGTIPGIYNVHEGAFRFTCGGDGKLAHVDPLVYPGQPGKSHLHLAWGSEDFTAFTTPDSLRAEPATNCNATPYSLNRSLYWMPALLHDSGVVVRPDLISVYYKRKTKTSPFCTPGDPAFMGRCEGLPDRIRFIWGWDWNKPDAPVQGATWYCTGGTKQHYRDLDAVFQSGCSAGDTLVADTLAPNCWDGRRTSSPDNRSHMAYVRYGDDGRPRCPATHPVLIPQEENKAMFTVTADMIGVRPDGTKYSRIRLASDHMKPNAKPGETLHADYMEAWVAAAKKLWTDHCIDKGLDGSGGDMCNGQQLVGAALPKYGPLIPTPRAAAPASSQSPSHHAPSPPAA